MTLGKAAPWLLGGVLALAALQLAVFATFDRRPPNDHDAWFAVDVDQDAEEFGRAGLGGKAASVARRALSRPNGHPQGAQAWLVAVAGTLGYSRVPFRLANLPFLLLMVLGMALAARQLGTVRLALLAAFVTATLPIVVHMSRKWFIHFHAAALVPLALACALAILRDRGATRRIVWIGLGAAVGLRAWMHPIVAPDGAVTIGLVGVLSLIVARRKGEALAPALTGLGLAAGAALLVAAPQLLWSTGPAPGAEGYEAHASTWLNTRRFDDQGWAGLARDMASMVGDVVGHHWMAPATWALFVPGLLAAPFVARSTRGLQVLFLALLALPQVAAAGFLHGTGAFVADWMHVHLELALIAVVWLDAALPERPRRVWAGALVAAGSFVLLAPLFASWSGPDPIAQPDAYDGWLEPFTRSDHGWTWETHHLLVREPQLGEVLAREVSDRRALRPGDDRQPLVVGVGDLTWTAPLGCGSGEGAWAVGPRHEARVPTFDLRAARFEVQVAELSGPIDVGVVRLWFEDVAPEGACELDAEARRRVVGEASMQAQGLLPGATLVRVDDFAARALDATEPQVNPTPGYAHVVFVGLWGTPE